MPQPKKKTSRSTRDARRSHWMKLDTPQIFKCPNCGGAVLAHQACEVCGQYKGRQVFVPKDKNSKKKPLDK